jgi:hypothetical protein
MPRGSNVIDAEGVPFWIGARVRRLSRLGVPQRAIARMMGLDVQHLKLHLRRRTPYQRCPACGGMVVAPCRACALRLNLANEGK